jgi:hypothetical protein
MLLLPPKAALAIAAVTDIALTARRAPITAPIQSKALAMRGLSERHLEPLLQALARHDILKSTRGLGQAEEAFSAELVRINVEDLVQSAAELGSLATGNEFAELPAC